MSQGVLPFQLVEEFSESGMTSLAGLPTYLELGHVLGLARSIEEHVKARGGDQGYTDVQILLPLILLNLAGGDCVADLERLADDPGFSRIIERFELHHLSRPEKRRLRKRWRKAKARTIPSASSVFRYLEGFSDPEKESERGYGKAYIPQPNKALLGLRRVNADLLASTYARTPLESVTLDLDATIKEVEKKDALVCYKGFPAYQPLNVWCAELEWMVHSEFRDGNVPASFENLRVFQEALGMLPEGVRKVSFRADSASYQHDLLSYMAEGLHPEYGIIEFAVGVPVEAAIKVEINQLEEADWKRLQVRHKKTKEWCDTSYEWAEVVHVPNRVAARASNPGYRYIVTREAVRQQLLPGTEDQVKLGFPTAVMNEQRYKLYAMATNRKESGDEVIRWYRERCGKSEQAHDTLKNELAGSQLPSNKFGVNAAWWLITVIAMNLNSAMKSLVLAPALGKQWAKKRFKAIRYLLINLPGRVVNHARELWIKIGGTAALSRLREIRLRIVALA
jgi:hypothetical protein